MEHRHKDANAKYVGPAMVLTAFALLEVVVLVVIVLVVTEARVVQWLFK